jgi:hypothetical protein
LSRKSSTRAISCFAMTHVSDESPHPGANRFAKTSVIDCLRVIAENSTLSCYSFKEQY